MRVRLLLLTLNEADKPPDFSLIIACDVRFNPKLALFPGFAAWYLFYTISK